MLNIKESGYEFRLSADFVRYWSYYLNKEAYRCVEVYVQLAANKNNEEGNRWRGYSWPSQELLMRRLHISRQSLYKALALLRKLRFIEIVRPSKMENNRYKILPIPPLDADMKQLIKEGYMSYDKRQAKLAQLRARKELMLRSKHGGHEDKPNQIIGVGEKKLSRRVREFQQSKEDYEHIKELPDSKFTLAMLRKWVRATFAHYFDMALSPFKEKEHTLIRHFYDRYCDDIPLMRKMVEFGMKEWGKKLSWVDGIPTYPSFHGNLPYIERLVTGKGKKPTGQHKYTQEEHDDINRALDEFR